MEPLPAQAKPIQKVLYSRKEAAELLSISISTLDMCVARNMIASRRMGSKRLIPHAALLAFAQKNLPQLWQPKSETGGRCARHPVSSKQLRLPFSAAKPLKTAKAMEEPAEALAAEAS